MIDLNKPVGKYTNLGYKAATFIRSTSHGDVSGSGDYHARYDRELLVNSSRGLDRNNWLYEATINRACDYILGPDGFTLQAKSGVKGVNDKLEGLWAEFWKKPEARETFTGRELEGITLRELLVAGDELFIKLKDGLLQHIESERIGSRKTATDDGKIKIEQGVRLDSRGRIVGFEIAGASKWAGYPDKAATTTVDAKNAIYLLNRVKRSSQTRGVPVLVSSMPIAYRLEDILDSEAVAWQVVSRLAFAVTTGVQGVEARATKKTARTDTTPATGDADVAVQDTGMALAFYGKKGQDIKGVSQTRPTQNFEQSAKLFIRLFGIPLGLPLELMLLDWGKLNYSSSRAVLLQAFIMFRAWQKLLIERFHSRVYRWQVGRWVAEGKIGWRPKLLEHTWDVPSWPWVDEDKEVSAWAKKLDRGLATQSDALGSQGKDRHEFLETRSIEFKEAVAAAKQLEADTDGLAKAEDTWRILAGIDPGKTEQAVRAGGTPPTAKETKDDDDDD